ncbi:MAG TPA: GAF domain-containing protein [Acidimicrobiales bacterium]|nr:GAF domain-containing protein [Acidimicrobiales bacterium]
MRAVPTEFGIAVSFAEGRAVLSLQGEVDLVTAPEFWTVISSLLSGANRDIVVDLGAVEFFGERGLKIIAASADRLSAIGGQLTIRSPRAVTRRLLEATGIAEQVYIESPDVASSPSPGSSRHRDSAAATLAQAAALSPATDVVDTALRLVAAIAREVTAADGASVSLARHGRLTTVASTDATVVAADRDQYATGEGPCVDASREGRWFVVENAEQEPRWPAFIPRVRERGINSILSAPLGSPSGPAGSLNMYAFAADAFAERDHALAALVAGHAADVLSGAGVGVTGERIAERFQAAVRAREVIALAQGVIMARDGVRPHEAYSVLRRSSVASGRPLRELAFDIVNQPRSGSPTSHPNESEAADA